MHSMIRGCEADSIADESAAIAATTAPTSDSDIAEGGSAGDEDEPYAEEHATEIRPTDTAAIALLALLEIMGVVTPRPSGQRSLHTIYGSGRCPDARLR